MPAPTTLLLVEDETHLREALAQMLVFSAYTVLVAGSGAEALRLGAERPDITVVVTDIRLPDMYGRHLARRIAAERGEDAPPLGVVFMSGNPEETEDGGPLSPNERFLPKPFEFEDLLACIAQVRPPASER